MSVSSSPCVVPGRTPSFTIPEGKFELGLGIHGEAGFTQIEVQPVFGALGIHDVAGVEASMHSRSAIGIHDVAGVEASMDTILHIASRSDWLSDGFYHGFCAKTLQEQAGQHYAGDDRIH